MQLNEKIFFARKKAGLSQVDLADQLGLSRQAVSKWETGESKPDISKLKSLAELLQVSVDWLLSEDCGTEDFQAEYNEQVSGNEPGREAVSSAPASYPDWLDRAPTMVGRGVRKYGWLFGVYEMIAGALCFAFGLVARMMARTMIFEAPFGGLELGEALPPELSQELGEMIQQAPPDPTKAMAWKGFSLFSGFLMVLGGVIVVIGLILAVRLRRWGQERS